MWRWNGKKSEWMWVIVKELTLVVSDADSSPNRTCSCLNRFGSSLNQQIEFSRNVIRVSLSWCSRCLCKTKWVEKYTWILGAPFPLPALTLLLICEGKLGSNRDILKNRKRYSFLYRMDEWVFIDETDRGQLSFIFDHWQWNELTFEAGNRHWNDQHFQMKCWLYGFVLIWLGMYSEWPNTFCFNDVFTQAGACWTRFARSLPSVRLANQPPFSTNA